MTPRHHIPLRDFDLLAAGGGDRETIRLLYAGERSRRLILLRALLDGLGRAADSWGPLPGADPAWKSLIAIQERAPEEFDRVFLLPQTGMWIVHCLRRLRLMDTGPVPLWVDVGYVYSIVLAVAARAGLEISVAVPHRTGCVTVPGLGMARVPGAPEFGLAAARVYDGRLRSRVGRHVVEVRLPAAVEAPGRVDRLGARDLRGRQHPPAAAASARAAARRAPAAPPRPVRTGPPPARALALRTSSAGPPRHAAGGQGRRPALPGR